MNQTPLFLRQGVCYLAETLGYYMRFFATGKPSPTLESVGEILRQAHPDMEFRDATLQQQGIPYGALEVNVAGEEMFEEERDEYLELLEDDESPGALRVRQVLRDCQATVVLQVLGSSVDLETILSRFDVLWETLLREPGGLMQADGEGFYEGPNLIWPLEDHGPSQIS